MTSSATRLSAISIATVLAVAAAPALAAPMFLKIKGLPGEGSSSGQSGEIEILSWSWGATQTSHGTGAGGMGAGKLQPGGGGGAAGGGVQVAAGDLDGDGRGDPVSLIPRSEVVSPRDSASGLATGKRQHKPVLSRVEGPMTITKEWDATTPQLRLAAPPPQGSLRVKVKLPWLACRVGARYPELQLGDAAATYTLTDVLVTSCGSSSGGDRPMEQISFNYARIEF